MAPGASWAPGSVSSSPVTSTATRGRRLQRNAGRPTEALTPSSAGPSRVPELKHPRPGGDVLARIAHVLTGIRRRYPDPAVRHRLLDVLQRDDRVGAVRHGGAGGDPHRRPRPHAHRGGMAGPRLTDDLELGRGAGRDRVAVHRRAGERGHADRAGHVLREHAAEGPSKRHLLRSERPDGGEHPLACRVDGDQRPAGAHSISPWRIPIATAWVRVEASSLARIRLVCVRTVSVDSPSLSATASVCIPSASICRISC